MNKNVIFLVALSVCIFATNADVFSQQKIKAQKSAAKNYINATVDYIKQAIAVKKKAHREDGEPYIAKAFDHQKHAIELYNAGSFEKAIYHSFKARKFTMLSMKIDKGKFEDRSEAEIVFKDFKDPKNIENKAFYKSMKKAFINAKDASIGDAEADLDSGIEVTEDDAKVDIRLLVNVS